MELTPSKIYLHKRSPRNSPKTVLGKRAPDDPARQLLEELGQQAGKVAREFNTRLDNEALEREGRHRDALRVAAEEHERVRNEAARAQELLQLALERDRQQREVEQQQALEQQRRETVHRDLQREVERKQQEVEEARRVQELRQAAAEAERRAAEIRAATPPVVATPTKVATAAASPLRALNESPSTQQGQPAQASTPAPLPSQAPAPQATFVDPHPNGTLQQNTASTKPVTQTINSQSTNGARAKHQRYLELHQRLKKLRQSASSLSDTNLKKKTGEFRREIKKSVGQLTIDMNANTGPYNKVRSVLQQAASLSQPQIDIRDYIAQDIPSTVDVNQNSAGLVQTYLLNIFAKAVFAQFVNEAGVAPKSAEPIGTIAIRIFAASEFRWQGVSLIDILMAKFHKKCPLLFGFKGALGTGEAMTGIGAGFAALSLRDFGKSTVQNPFPPFNYWQAMACLLNVLPNQINQAHCIILKAMIENHAAKFIKFFGQPAILALKKAIVEFPSSTSKTAATSALSTLQVTLRRDIHLTL